ncbi:MAG: GYDIA family GHMP kinase [Flavobacteriaceae bacterium]
MKTFYSNGKLLLTGEYVVLDGATALAIPTKYGQGLTVEKSEKEGIHWKSLDEKGEVWFEINFQINDTVSEQENKVLYQLLQILREAKKINPSFLEKEKNWKISTKLNFSTSWGLGTSSTLINNIAQWAQVDAFQLLQKSFGGSGYDIAAAQNNEPILYSLIEGKPKVEKIRLNWNFTDQLFFVHLNKKQDSKEGIKRYHSKLISTSVISKISQLASLLIEVKTLSEFETIISDHETLISKMIQLPTIKERLFQDYPNVLKSLGAWGGDFILATGNNKGYFTEKGFTTIIPFGEMILK